VRYSTTTSVNSIRPRASNPGGGGHAGAAWAVAATIASTISPASERLSFVNSAGTTT